MGLLASMVGALGCSPTTSSISRPLPAVVEVPLGTFSIVARDAATGELGVAVQSHWFQVARMVPWAESGVGAVATQALTNPAYGPRGLALMQKGRSADQALKQLLRTDSARQRRQVAMVDAHGRVTAWTGRRCIAEAGHLEGDGFVVQANLMSSSGVWSAMAAAYRRTRGPLAERMLAALEAAQQIGGDRRGQQSAALLVVRAKASDEPWADRLVDLRVADHAQPLVELRRLLNVRRAYDAWAAGDRAMTAKRYSVAAERYSEARRRLPENAELAFWEAVTLYKHGRETEAIERFVSVLQRAPRWLAVLRRLPAADILAPGAVDRVLAATRKSKRPGAEATTGDAP